MQKMKQLKNVIFSIALLVLVCLTACNDESSQNKSESASAQDITELTEVSSTDTTAVSSYDNSDKNSNDLASKNEDTVTTTSIRTTGINQNADTMKTTETSMKENQSAEATTKTGTYSPYDKKEPDDIATTNKSNTTIHKTETTTVTLPDIEEQFTHKRDENELPGVDPFA